MFENYKNAIPFIIGFLIMFLLIDLYYFKNIRKKENIEKKHKVIGFIILGILLIGNVILFITNPSTDIIRSEFVAFSMSCVLFVSIIDLLYSYILTWEMWLTELCLIGLPILFNSLFGCPCIMKYNIIFLFGQIIFMILNSIFNKQKFIGIADLDLFSSIIFGLCSVLLAVNETSNMSSIIMYNIFGGFLNLILFNIMVYMIIAIPVSYIKKRNKKLKESISNAEILDETSDSEKENEDEIDNSSTKSKFKSLNEEFRIIAVFILPYIFVSLLLYSK